VIISQKWCTIEMLLLQTNNNKWYWIAAIPMILSDLPGFSHIASLCKWVFFIQLCSNWKSKLCGSWRLWALLVLLQWPFTPCYGQIHRIMISDMTSLVRVKSYNSVFFHFRADCALTLGCKLANFYHLSSLICKEQVYINSMYYKSTQK